jgi:hypothetical protein
MIKIYLLHLTIGMHHRDFGIAAEDFGIFLM